MKKNVICEETDGNSVHARLDRGVKKYGSEHRELDEWHNPEAMRDIIDNYINSLGTISPDTCTDYVRIAYGHITLDHVASKLKRKYNCNYADLDWNEVFKKAWELYKRSGYYKKFFKQY